MSSGSKAHHVLALSGGVGGARLARGLARVLPPGDLTIVCNTADDFTHFGLLICPDIDSVTYALAGLNDEARGWGVRDESWTVMESLRRIGVPDWFLLGDRDLATHLYRRELLDRGMSLTDATAAICRAHGIAARVVPMSDDPVRTIVRTADGDLHFQDYFVGRRCEPAVAGFRFDGAETARPQRDFMELLQSDDLRAIVICPSNPFVSVDPILSLAGVREALRNRRAPLVAVSPIIGGQAVKGPAAKMLRELGLDSSAAAVARHYGDLLDGFILDDVDRHLAPEIAAAGVAVRATGTLMKSAEDSARLAEHVLDLADSVREGAACGR